MTGPTRLISAVLATLTIALAVGIPLATAESEPSSLAWFEGRVIDLSEPWGEAHACAISDDGNYCFRTDAELRDFLGEPSSDANNELGPLATCGTFLFLYDGTNKTGDSIALNQRSVTINLSTYSFANRTSSYQIGGCSAVFRDGGGSVYPGNTSAGASANSMATGWNNRVTSVFIA